jgi:formate/nitrite transporter FocA (FNT family)
MMGLLLRAAFVEDYANLFTSLDSMVSHKLDSVWYLKGIKSFFCGMLVYLAVEGFNKIENNFGKYVVLVLCIAGFIFAGFEHCVANMFYFSIAGSWNVQTLVITLVVALGNSVGGMLIPFIRGFIND